MTPDQSTRSHRALIGRPVEPQEVLRRTVQTVIREQHRARAVVRFESTVNERRFSTRVIIPRIEMKLAGHVQIPNAIKLA